jgi:hypothetical protein
MLLSQVIRGVAITGRTDAVGEQLLGRQGGRWAHQWIDGAFPDAAARSHGAPPPVDAAAGPHGAAPAADAAARSQGVPPPADAAAALRALEDLRRRGFVTDDEFERLRPARGG